MKFTGNSAGAKNSVCIITRVAPYRKFFAEIMTRSGGVLKRSNLKLISTSLDVLGKMGWYIKDFHDFKRA